jgi:hypothetical protein
MLVYFMDIWSILRTFDTFYGHFVYFVVIWYIFPRVGKLHQEKSGNPAWGWLVVGWLGGFPWWEIWLVLVRWLNSTISMLRWSPGPRTEI